MRHRCLPADAPRRPQAAPAVRPSRRCGGPARARAGLSRAALRPPAGGVVAVGRVRVGRDRPARRARGHHVDGDRRAHSRAHARRDVLARRPGTRRAARAPLRAVRRPGRRRESRVRVPRSHFVGSDRVHLLRMGGRCGGRRLRLTLGRGRPAVPRSHRRGRGARSNHPRRGKCVGALRGRRAPLLTRALPPSLGASGASDGHDGRSLPEPATGSRGDFSRVVDRRELLYLDWARRRSAGVEPAGGRPRGVGLARKRGARRRRAGARRGVDRRRRRLVLVVRRRSFVRARRGVRRPVPAAPAKRVSIASETDSRRALPQQYLNGGLGWRSDHSVGLCDADHRWRGNELLRMARRRQPRNTEARRGDASGRSARARFDAGAVRVRPRAFVRAAGRGPPGRRSALGGL